MFARVSSSVVGLGSSTASPRLTGRVPLAGLYVESGASRLAGSTGAVRTSSTWAALRPTAAAASGGGLAVVLGEVSEVIASDLSGPIADVEGLLDKRPPGPGVLPDRIRRAPLPVLIAS